MSLFLLFRPWLRRWIGSQGLALLWLPLLARLLFPLPIASPWAWMPASLYEKGKGANRTEIAVVERVEGERAREGGQATAATPEGSVSQGAMATLLGSVWLCGAMAAAGWLAVQAFRTRRLAGRMAPVTDPSLLELFHSIAPELRGRVGLKKTRAVEIPALTGIFRPEIWIPEGWQQRWTAREMRYILLHELGHANRRDLLVQGLFSLARCLHWFNPLVGLAGRRAGLDREMACDAWVLSRCGEHEAEEYGMTLLKTARWLPDGGTIATAGVLGMASTRSRLSARIVAIGGFSAVPVWRGWAGGCVAIAVLAALTTAGKAARESPPREFTVTRKAIRESDRGSSMPAIRVETRLIHVPEAAMGRVRQNLGDLSGLATQLPSKIAEKRLKHLLRRPGVEVIALPSVTTASGSSFRVDLVEAVPFSPRGKAGALETRKVGLQFEATPAVAPDGVTIDLAFTCELTRRIGYGDEGRKGGWVRMEPEGRWVDRLLDSSLPAGASPNQPVFAVQKVSGTLSCWEGQTLVAFGREGGAGEGRVLIVLTPVIVP